MIMHKFIISCIAFKFNKSSHGVLLITLRSISKENQARRNRISTETSHDDNKITILFK
jgi:hypothetical protein